MPATLVLDLDGTLVDTTDAIVDGVLDVCAEVGLPIPNRALVESRIGHDPVGTWALLGAEDAEATCALFSERVLPTLGARTTALPGVAEALAELTARGHRLAVATTRLTASAWDSLRHTGLDAWLPVVIGRDQVARPKPAPDIVLAALTAVDGTPADALMIGDSDADVLAAHGADVPCWAVLGGTGTEEALRAAGADRILDGGFAALPAALDATG